MPNYCENSLAIKAAPEVMNEIFAFVKSEECEFDFNKIVPMPEGIYMGDLSTGDFERYPLNWYHWSIKNWGTKWNCSEVYVDGETINFHTANGTCEPVIAALARRFPQAIFWYETMDLCDGWCGVDEYRNGERVYSMQGSYEDNIFAEMKESEMEEDREFYEQLLLEDEYDFPIREYGFFEEVEFSDEVDGKVEGNLYYREYENNKIRKMINGEFWDCRNDEKPRYW